jgi:hypothetical protein
MRIITLPELIELIRPFFHFYIAFPMYALTAFVLLGESAGSWFDYVRYDVAPLYIN